MRLKYFFRDILIFYICSIICAGWLGFLVFTLTNMDIIGNTSIETSFTNSFLNYIFKHLIIGIIISTPLLILGLINFLFSERDCENFLKYLIFTSFGFYVGLLSFVWLPLIIPFSFLCIPGSLFFGFSYSKDLLSEKNFSKTKIIILSIIFSLFLCALVSGIAFCLFYFDNSINIIAIILTIFFMIMSPRIE